MKNPHVILGVDRDADLEAIKRAYLQLAKTAHPDAGGSQEDFVRLQSAYDAMTEGCTPAETVTAGRPAASQQRAAGSAEWKSYEDIMKAVRERLDRDDERRPRADRHPQPRSMGDFCLAAVLTLLCAGTFATLRCSDGEPWDQLLWSSSFRSAWALTFAVTLALLVYVCGLAAVLVSTPVTNSMTVYRRLVVFVLIVLFVVIVGSVASAFNRAGHPRSVVPHRPPRKVTAASRLPILPISDLSRFPAPSHRPPSLRGCVGRAEESWENAKNSSKIRAGGLNRK